MVVQKGKNKKRRAIKLIRILYRLMRQTTITTFCIHLVNNLRKMQSSSKHYSVFKRYSSPDDQKTRVSLLNEATGSNQTSLLNTHS